MITLWTRLNAVFFYAVTVLVFLGLGSAVTTLWMQSHPVVSLLRINKLLTLRPQQESIRRPDTQDRAIFTFDLDAGAVCCAWPARRLASVRPLTSVPPSFLCFPPPPPPSQQTSPPCLIGMSSSCLCVRIPPARSPQLLPLIRRSPPRAPFLHAPRADVSATYATKRNGTNEVVVWDKVVNSSSLAVLHVVNEFNKYPLVDKRQELRGAKVTLSLCWDIMPITGLLHKHCLPYALLKLPEQYCLDREASGAGGKAVPANVQLLSECDVTPLPLPQAGKGRAPPAAAAKRELSWADEI